MSGLWLGYKIIFRKNKQKNQRSAAREPAWQHNEWEEEANKHSAEKKSNTLADSTYFYTEE